MRIPLTVVEPEEALPERQQVEEAVPAFEGKQSLIFEFVTPWAAAFATEVAAVLLPSFLEVHLMLSLPGWPRHCYHFQLDRKWKCPYRLTCSIY